MGIGDKARTLLGEKRYQTIRETILLLRDTVKGTKRNVFNGSVERFSVPNAQTFFGYYDLNQFNKSESRILAHVVTKNADPQRDVAQIGYFNLKSPTVFHSVSRSNAWCWQQGSRLRWGNDGESSIWFNDFVDGEYCCKCVNIQNGTIEHIVPYPLYDIDKRFQNGLTLDYERLQRYRPGYGYNLKKQDSISDDLTIGLVKLDTGVRVNIVSINECLTPDEEKKYIPYFNHLCFSPNGKNFLFFVVLKENQSDRWRVKLFVKNLESNKLSLLEEEERASHYAWKNDNEILVTLMNDSHHEHYCVFNVSEETKKEIGGDVLKSDGHPTFFEDQESFVSDTYPLGDDHQELFRFSKEKGKQILGHVYYDPRGRADKRCDLHPRLSKSQRMIAIDSLNRKNERSIFIMRIEE